MAGPKTPGSSRAPPLEKQSKLTMVIKHFKDKAPPKTSKLLELPAELRDCIFRYALVSDEPIKVRFSSVRWFSKRRRFTMIPGLINVSKQLRSETQRIFFEDNTFEITPGVPEVWMKRRSDAPLLLLRTMHHNQGLELRSVSICQEITLRAQKNLFQLKASFTVSMDASGGLTIAKQDYSGNYIGRSLPSAPPLGACGCEFAVHARIYNTILRGTDIVQFLRDLKKRNYFRYGAYRSYHFRDLLRKDKVYYADVYCGPCRRRGRLMITF